MNVAQPCAKPFMGEGDVENAPLDNRINRLGSDELGSVLEGSESMTRPIPEIEASIAHHERWERKHTDDKKYHAADGHKARKEAAKAELKRALGKGAV